MSDAVSMIERVARAIYDQQSDGIVPVSDFYPVARAAIEAMREPTDAMVDAGRGLKHPAHVYIAAIDAALNEQVAG